MFLAREKTRTFPNGVCHLQRPYSRLIVVAFKIYLVCLIIVNVSVLSIPPFSRWRTRLLSAFRGEPNRFNVKGGQHTKKKKKKKKGGNSRRSWIALKMASFHPKTKSFHSLLSMRKTWYDLSRWCFSTSCAPLFFCHFRVLFFSSFYSSLTGGAQRLLSLFLFSIVGTVGVNAHVKTFTILPSFFSSIPRHLRPSAFDHDPYRSAFWFTKNGDVRWNQAEGKGESWGHRFPWQLVCVFLFVLVIIIIAACQ